MSDIKLEPCPFCGGEAKYESDMPLKELYTISCENKDCAAKPYVIGMTKQEAEWRWNTRKPMERIAEQLEEKIAGLRKIDNGESTVDVAIKELQRAIEIVQKGGAE